MRKCVNNNVSNIRDKNKETGKKDVWCNNNKESLIKSKTIGSKDKEKKKENTKSKNKEKKRNKKLK